MGNGRSGRRQSYLTFSLAAAIAAQFGCPGPEGAKDADLPRLDAAHLDSTRDTAVGRDSATPVDALPPDAAATDADSPVDAAVVDSTVVVDAGPVSMALREVASSGYVRAVLVDVTTNAPVVGALLVSGASVTTSHEDGSLWFAAPPGPVAATVTAEHYVDWSGSLQSMDPPILHTLYLKQRSAPVTIAATGTKLHGLVADLEFPAGSYNADTDLIVTTFDEGEIRSLQGPQLFAQGAEQRLVLGAIEVTAPIQPALPVVLRMPVPQDVGVNDVWLYTLDQPSQTWRDPLAPVSVASGIAQFSVSSFSVKALARIPAGQPFWGVVSQSMGRVRRVAPTAAFLQPGDHLYSNDVLQTERGTWARLSTGEDIVYLFESSQIAIGPVTYASGTRQRLITLQGPGKVFVNSLNTCPDPSNPCFVVVDGETGARVQTMTLGSTQSGHAFRLQHIQCSLTPSFSDVLVTQGSVRVNLGADEQDLDARQWLTSGVHGLFLCSGCALLPSSVAPACCNLETCDFGCCTQDGQCAFGDQRRECGTAGEACQRCPFDCTTGGQCVFGCEDHGDCPGQRCVDRTCLDCTPPAVACSGLPCDPDIGIGRCSDGGCGLVCVYESREMCGDGLDTDFDGKVDESGIQQLNGPQGVWHPSNYVGTYLMYPEMSIHGCYRCDVDEDCPGYAVAWNGPGSGGGNGTYGYQQYCSKQCDEPRGMSCTVDSDCSGLCINNECYGCRGTGYCVDCPARGCTFCTEDADCGSFEACVDSICLPCKRICAPGSHQGPGTECWTRTDCSMVGGCTCMGFGNGCGVWECGS